MQHSTQHKIISRAIRESLDLAELAFQEDPAFPKFRKSFLKKLNDLRRDLLGEEAQPNDEFESGAEQFGSR